jgi:hypothetical protein
MVRLIVAVAVAGVIAGCNTSSSTRDQYSEADRRSEVWPGKSLAIFLPDNPGDRTIRRELHASIARDAALNAREISFIVTKGDVNVTGTVRTEQERRRMNDLAMNIDGVKSIANALRIVD